MTRRECPTCGGSGGGPECFRCPQCRGAGSIRGDDDSPDDDSADIPDEDGTRELRCIGIPEDRMPVRYDLDQFGRMID